MQHLSIILFNFQRTIRIFDIFPIRRNSYQLGLFLVTPITGRAETICQSFMLQHNLLNIKDQVFFQHPKLVLYFGITE